MADWDAWIGREERRHDRVDPALVGRWLATLDRTAPADGTVPQGLHWCLCTPDALTAALGLDGHPQRDGGPDRFFPPIPLPRRMWASSKVEFLAPLEVDEAVTRVSRLLSVTEKQGASGALAFVEVAHETSGENGVALREVQSLVYRGAADADAALTPPPPGKGSFDPSGWQTHRALIPSETLLFRYSALTFNTHRIHYDAPYATGEERYRGLVVHGPLMASLLLDLAREELGDNALKTFAFRAVSPAICGEMLHLVLRSKAATFEFGAFASDGREVIRASATS